MLWDLILLFAGLGLAGLGLVNPGTAPIWFSLAGLLLIVAAARWLRPRVPAALVRLGNRLGASTAAPNGPRDSRPTVSAVLEEATSAPIADLFSPAAVEHARLLRVAAEPPERRNERDAIRADARRIAMYYRGMAHINGIEATDDMSRLAWMERVIAVQRRRDGYSKRWPVALPDPLDVPSAAAPVQPDWLEAMAREADLVAWQLDHETVLGS